MFFLHKAFGKLLFILLDFCTAILVEKVLKAVDCNDTETKAAICIWLFNPVTIAVSCRGNAESILSTLAVAVVYAVVKKSACCYWLFVCNCCSYENLTPLFIVYVCFFIWSVIYLLFYLIESFILLLFIYLLFYLIEKLFGLEQFCQFHFF